MQSILFYVSGQIVNWCLQVLVGSEEVSIFLAGETNKPVYEVMSLYIYIFFPLFSFVYILQYLLLNLWVHQRHKVLQGTFLLAFLFVIFFFSAYGSIFSVTVTLYVHDSWVGTCFGGVMVFFTSWCHYPSKPRVARHTASFGVYSSTIPLILDSYSSV